jgi:hypothetical protein
MTGLSALQLYDLEISRVHGMLITLYTYLLLFLFASKILSLLVYLTRYLQLFQQSSSQFVSHYDPYVYEERLLHLLHSSP